MPSDEKELVLLAQKGDNAAFQQLVYLYDIRYRVKSVLKENV